MAIVTEAALLHDFASFVFLAKILLEKVYFASIKSVRVHVCYSIGTKLHVSVIVTCLDVTEIKQLQSNRMQSA